MAVENIINQIKNLDLTPGNTKFQLISWPYSRKLIRAICEYKGVTVKYKRLDKRFEVFVFPLSEKSVDSIKLIIKQVNKLAKPNVNFVITRNQIVEQIKEKLIGELIHVVVNGDEQKPSCPQCDSPSVIKNGKDKTGEQKYKCKDCGHSFTKPTGKVKNAA